MIFNATTVLAIINFNLAIFWIFILLGIKRHHNRSDKLLTFLIILIALSIAATVLRESDYILQVPHLIAVTFPLNFVIPPMFYLYIRSLTNKQIVYKTELFHFLPALLVILWMLPFYFSSATTKLNEVQNRADSSNEITAILILAWEIVYIIYSLFLLRTYSNFLQQVRSSTDKLTLDWILNLIIAYIMVAIYYSISLFYNHSTDWPIGSILTFIMLYVLGFMGFRQLSTESVVEEIKTVSKYKKSSLTDNLEEQNMQKLNQFMEAQKPYLDSNLSLNNLASQIDVSPHHLSQMLNDKLKQSFYDYINNYRVDEAKQQFADPEKYHYKILAIAYDVGFNSKSHFNTAFKKYTKMTPSQFRHTIQLN